MGQFLLYPFCGRLAFHVIICNNPTALTSEPSQCFALWTPMLSTLLTYSSVSNRRGCE